MKLFYTPAIDGQFREDLKRRMADVPDADAVATVRQYGGQYAIDQLDERGWTKLNASDGTKITGYWTYQQDEL